MFTEIFLLCKTGTTAETTPLETCCGRFNFVLEVIFELSKGNLELNWSLLKEVLYFSFIMVKCLTCAKIFCRQLSPSFYSS